MLLQYILSGLGENNENLLQLLYIMLPHLSLFCTRINYNTVDFLSISHV